MKFTAPAENSSRRFGRILIANRGEVAVRIARACRELGIFSVGVFSDADIRAPHVLAVDEAIRIGGSRASESYLAIERIVAAARGSAADAIHPGFGFLAENADFANAVRSAGIEFIGPSADAIRLMGSKADARRIAVDLGLPVVPGYDGDDQSVDALSVAAERVGFPLLIKAAAGGGGTGIRIVQSRESLPADIASAKSEARSAFGSDKLILERYLGDVRHIEVQLIADRYGNVRHLFDRECSIQRRRQKVVEEAPSSLHDQVLRSKIISAAMEIAESVRYQSLGTVEFLVDERAGEYFFLEMNTRLQVEHGITEMITGVDLVDAQIRIAEGERIAVTQQTIATEGHAIECRLYAESPAEGFAPTSGTIRHCRFPDVPDSRIDAAIDNGTVISPFYDPMLAKLMTWGRTRDDAIRRMRSMLAGTQVLGVVTNAAMLGRLVASPEFTAGEFNTQFLERNLRRYVESIDEIRLRRFACIAAVIRHVAVSTAGVDEFHPRETCLLEGGHEFRVRVSPSRAAGSSFDVTCAELAVRIELLATPGEHEFVFRVGDVVHRVYAVVVADSVFIQANAPGTIEFTVASAASIKAGTDVEGKHRAAMPGRIIEICVAEGACVRPGERLLAMESMKMEHAIVARMAGVVRSVPAVLGQVVEKGSLLIAIDYEVVVASAAVGGAKR